MKKKILLAILNIAAAALIGIIIGIYIKYLHPGEKSGGSSLTEKIEALAGNADARIGLAAVFPDGSIMTYSNSRAAASAMFSRTASSRSLGRSSLEISCFSIKYRRRGRYSSAGRSSRRRWFLI